jgi:RNA 2',3'-cyclic 3'-phosphodiesterase
MPRLFVAIDLPEGLKDPLTGFIREVPLAKWVGREELHLTLRFIGEVDDRTFSAIKTGLSRISFSPFMLTLCGVGHFPPRAHPRVLWVGMQPSDGLVTLQQDVELALADIGLQPDERPFSPHITLARLRDTAPAVVAEFERRHKDLVCSPFEVTEFILFSSVLTPKGAIHTKEAIYNCRREEPPQSPTLG